MPIHIRACLIGTCQRGAPRVVAGDTNQRFVHGQLRAYRQHLTDTIATAQATHRRCPGSSATASAKSHSNTPQPRTVLHRTAANCAYSRAAAGLRQRSASIVAHTCAHVYVVRVRRHVTRILHKVLGFGSSLATTRHMHQCAAPWAATGSDRTKDTPAPPVKQHAREGAMIRPICLSDGMPCQVTGRSALHWLPASKVSPPQHPLRRSRTPHAQSRCTTTQDLACRHARPTRPLASCAGQQALPTHMPTRDGAHAPPHTHAARFTDTRSNCAGEPLNIVQQQVTTPRPLRIATRRKHK
ncbi:hypothetical protein COO60DRAFT_30388 [Scenedesmus sp. NREL 46B-D3]|nr:hypothetical protein COO60DRAFT_30388 [Scenedesmus sp. NREL 46B-D3]